MKTKVNSFLFTFLHPTEGPGQHSCKTSQCISQIKQAKLRLCLSSLPELQKELCDFVLAAALSVQVTAPPRSLYTLLTPARSLHKHAAVC